MAYWVAHSCPISQLQDLNPGINSESIPAVLGNTSV